MMALLGGLILLAGFIILLAVFGLVEKSKQVIDTAQAAARVVQNSTLSDYEKEVAMQGYAKTLLKLFVLITGGSALAVAIPLGVVWLMALSQIFSLAEVIALTLSWQFILATVVVSIIFFKVRGGKSK